MTINIEKNYIWYRFFSYICIPFMSLTDLYAMKLTFIQALCLIFVLSKAATAQQTLECPFLAAIVSCPNPLGGGTSTALRLKWNSNTFPGCIPDTLLPDTVTMMYSMDGGISWQNENIAKIGSSCEGAPKYAVNYHVPSFGGCQCTLFEGLVRIKTKDCYYVDGLLPIQLGAINVNYLNRTPLLQWTTLTEKNSAYFTIERSTDGQNFKSVGNVPAKDQSLVETYYQFEDRDNDLLSAGIDQLYYRLIMLDKDGYFNYSPTVTLQVNRNGSGLKLIKTRNWNSTDDLVAYYNSDLNESVVVTLTDVNGKVIASKESEAQQGLNDTNLQLGQLSNGVYFLTVSNSHTAHTMKLVHQSR